MESDKKKLLCVAKPVDRTNTRYTPPATAVAQVMIPPKYNVGDGQFMFISLKLYNFHDTPSNCKTGVMHQFPPQAATYANNDGGYQVYEG